MNGQKISGNIRAKSSFYTAWKGELYGEQGTKEQKGKEEEKTG
jgi:hypothetical protein